MELRFGLVVQIFKQGQNIKFQQSWKGFPHQLVHVFQQYDSQKDLKETLA